MHVSELFVYPVKSMAGIALSSSKLMRTGLEFDRRWMVVHPDGTFMTQRSYPQLALIETEIVDGKLQLSSFGLDPHLVDDNDRTDNPVHTNVFGADILAVEHSLATSAWLSQALDTPCKLVSFARDETRQCDPEYAREGDQTYFADGFPLLLISQASLDDLNGRLDNPVTMDRFRPNIVVSDCAPYAEDDWRKLMVNDIPLRFAKACARCSVPTVNQQTGMLSGPEPIATLSGYRQKGNEIYFGINMSPDKEGTINVGDAVEVRE